MTRMLEGERVGVKVHHEQLKQIDDMFRDVGSLINSYLKCPSLAKVMSGRRQMSPAGIASLLLGIASALMLLGSLAFFLGLVMMPMVATLAITFSFIGILDSFFPFTLSHLLNQRKMVNVRPQ